MKSCQIPCDLPLGVQENHQNHAGYRADGCWRECCQQVDHATVCSNAGSITYIQHTHTHRHTHTHTHTHKHIHPSMHSFVGASNGIHPVGSLRPTRIYKHTLAYQCPPIAAKCNAERSSSFTASTWSETKDASVRWAHSDKTASSGCGHANLFRQSTL